MATHRGKCKHVWSRKHVCCSGPAPGCWHTAPASESSFQERASGNPPGQAAPHGAASAYLPPSCTSWASSAHWKDTCHPVGDGKHALLLRAVNAKTTSLALDILAEKGYMNPREPMQSREMRTAPGFNICFEKRLGKSSFFTALEGRLQGDPATAFKTEESKRQAQWTADYPVDFCQNITLKKSGRFSGNIDRNGSEPVSMNPNQP